MKTIVVLLLAIAALTVSPARADRPKGYTVTLSEMKIGSAQFAAGEYRLLIHRDESKVQLMETKTGNVVDITGKLENADAKFDRTEVHSQNVNGASQITEIRIGGTNLRVSFRQPS